jgi:hypothetical protein
MRITTSADHHTITLDLEQYLTTIVARYEFEGLQSVPTLMLHDLKLTKEDCPTTDEAKEAMQAYPFRSAISSLMFAMVAMRVNPSYVVTCIARFSANPGLPTGTRWYECTSTSKVLLTWNLPTHAWRTPPPH